MVTNTVAACWIESIEFKMYLDEIARELGKVSRHEVGFRSWLIAVEYHVTRCGGCVHHFLNVGENPRGRVLLVVRDCATSDLAARRGVVGILEVAAWAQPRLLLLLKFR